MSVVLTLKQRGEMTADQLAVVLGIEIEHAYLELVRAEAQGLVRVNCYGHTNRTWEAM